MSFGGGGTADYRINYIITTSTQGAGAGPINQVAAATDKLGTASTSAAAAQHKLEVANNKVQQANLGVSKAAKGLTFGILGITTAGAEMMGMLSMWQQTQIGVKEAQQGVNDAIEEFGKGSQQHKQALQDVAKANRWAQMTQRNLMLSMFDMIPFIALTINGLAKLKTALAAKAAAAKELAMVNTTLSRSELGLAASTKTAGASMLLNANGMNVASKAGLGFRGTLAAVGTAASGLLIKLAPLLAILAAIGVATILYANNIGGLKAAFDGLGVALGNAIPQLKGVLTTIGAVAEKLGKGDLQGAIDVLMQKVTGETTLEQISKKDEKAAKEIEELYDRVRENRLQLFSDLAHMEKKEQKAELFNQGIKGGAKTRFKDTLKDFKQFEDTLTNFGKAWDTAQMAMLLKDRGFKVPDSMFKKIEFTFEDRFNELDKMIKGPTGDIFGNLADELRADAEKGGQNFNEIMLKYMKGPDGAELMRIAEEFGFTEFVEIATEIIDREEKKLVDRIFDAKGKLEKEFSSLGKIGTKQKGWWNMPELENENPVRQNAQLTADQLSKLPPGFAAQFPGTHGKGITLPPVTQDVKLNITDMAGHTYSSTGSFAATGFTSVITAAIGGLFNVGAWQRAITNLGNPSFWGGLAVDLNRFIDNHIPQLANMTGAGADSSAGLDVGQGTGFSNWIKTIQGVIGPLFHAGNWQTTIVSMGNPSFWGALATDLDHFIQQHIPQLAAMSGAGADESGGMNAGQGQGFSIWIKYIQDTLAPLFHTGNWQSVIVTGLNPQFWATLTSDLNNHVQNNLSRLEATKNEPNSGGMNVGQDKWLQYATDMLSPIFDIKTWQNALEPLMNGFKAFVDGIKGQQAEAISGIIIEPEFDFRNDVPKAHNGMEFKNGKWVKSKRSGLGPRGQDKMSMDITGYVHPVATWTGPNGQTTSDIPFMESGADPLPPVPIEGQIVNIIVPDTLGQSTIETTTAIFNLWNSLVSNVSTVWNALMASMEQVELDFLEGTNAAFQGTHDLIISIFDSIAIVWSERGIGIIETSEIISSESTDHFLDMMDNAGSIFVGIADMWAANAENMVSDAETMADKINNALDSIEDEEVIIHYKADGSPSNPKAHGEEGMWVHKPTTFLAGEQGSEFVTVTRAHSKPGLHNDDGEGGGTDTVVFNGAVNLRIDGNSIINDTKLNRRIKMTVGENRDRFG